MVTHMPLFLYFNFLTNVFSFFYFIKIIKIFLLLSFQLWSLYYTNKRQGPFELYNPFSHFFIIETESFELRKPNMAHFLSSQNRSWSKYKRPWNRSMDQWYGITFVSLLCLDKWFYLSVRIKYIFLKFQFATYGFQFCNYLWMYLFFIEFI